MQKIKMKEAVEVLKEAIIWENARYAGKISPDFRFLGSLLYIGQLIAADLSISDYF